MKLISFSRDSEVELVINPANPGTYDLSFSCAATVPLRNNKHSSNFFIFVIYNAEQ